MSGVAGERKSVAEECFFFFCVRYARELREGWARQKEWLESERPEWSSDDEDEEDDEDERDAGPKARDAVEAQMERELEVLANFCVASLVC